jgi:hypothetical protein
MMNKIIFGSLWVAFSAYAFLLAPPDRPDTLQLILDLSTGKWAGINPLIVALFNIMGVLPMIYACLMLIDGKYQKISAGGFTAVSFGVGAFAILPYLALRESYPTSKEPEVQIDRAGLIKLVDSRWLAIVLSIASIGLLTYGITQGNWADFVRQWQTSRFIHVMSLDFCMLVSLLPVLINDDIQRRNFTNPNLIRSLSFIPLLGGLLYLCLRPSRTGAASGSEVLTSG